MKRYFTPVAAHTGARHLQPALNAGDAARGGSYLAPRCGGDFTPDYVVFVDARGALDAPDALPSGGVTALDFPELTLGIANTYREPRQ